MWMVEQRTSRSRASAAAAAEPAPLARMMSRGEVHSLRSIRAPANSVLSVYLNVPRDPAALGELRARVDDLVQAAEDASGYRLAACDLRAVQAALASHARDWLGHALALFFCADLGLQRVLTLPGQLAERAILATSPHVRPLLAALQRGQDYRIVIIDRRHARLLAVSGEHAQNVAITTVQPAGRANFGGWHGFDSYGAGQRVAELGRQHYRDTAAVLAAATRDSGAQPLVIGGHTADIKQLLGYLPREMRDAYAGCFAADPHVLTPAKARDLAAPVLRQWIERRERQLVEQVTAPEADVHSAIGLHACLAAVNADEQDLLLIPDDGTVPGYVCERCDLLTMTSTGCCDWGVASRWVPDLLEEMAIRTLRVGGDVVSVRELRCGVAARLRRC